MSVRVRRATEDELDGWDELVRRSPKATPFHLAGAMEVLAEHSNSTLHPLVGLVGEETVGLLPVYERRLGPVSAVFSPPPSLKVSSQGPLLLNFEKLKARKATRRHATFIDECLAYVDREIGPRYLLLRTSPGYYDARPLAWNGLSVTPRYTYTVDLGRSQDDLLQSFSGDARRNITGDHDRGVEIHQGGTEAITQIVTQLRERHLEQGEAYPVTPGFVHDLYRTLPEGTVRPYECTVDGEFAGGMITVELSDTIYRWQGGAKTDLGVPISDLVDWHVICDASERGHSRYDLVGADTRRLAGYKAKFAPELEPFFEAIRSGLAMRTLAGVYKRLR